MEQQSLDDSTSVYNIVTEYFKPTHYYCSEKKKKKKIPFNVFLLTTYLNTQGSVGDEQWD